MLLALTMPQFGESITHSRIIHWLKREGDLALESEPLVEMETEKAVFSYESPFRGRLVKVLQPDDTEVAVGVEIAHFEVTEEDGKKYLSLGVGREVSRGGLQTAPTPSAGKGVSPLIRSLAKEHGIPLEEVEKLSGTGPGGHLTKEDFLEYLKGRGGPPVPQGIHIVPLTPIRARIADNMVLSKTRTPHAGCSVEVDLAAIEGWRADQKKAPGYLPFAVTAVLKAIGKYPAVNCSWREAAGKRWIEQYDFVHIGIAVATEQGLIVPVIREAHTLSFKEISGEIDRLVEGGRKGTLKPQELAGATFSVNNSGALGAIRSDQIIPYPQAAILAINRVVLRPWVVTRASGGRSPSIEIRPVMNLDLAFDHRVIDGDLAVRFLTAVREGLENFDFSRL